MTKADSVTRAFLTMNIQTIKASIKHMERSSSLMVRCTYYLMRSIWIMLWFCWDSERRSQYLLRWFRGEEAHQIANFTRFDRYPRLFAACRDYFSASEGLRLLSYGCSTGEEVFALRSYFPNAFIFGVDINSWNVSQCRKKNRDPKIEFRESYKIELAETAPFDAIFCLAVLQDTRNRRDNVQDSSSIYPFAKFDAKILELDGYLKKGGLFVIANSDYRFSDSSIFTRYRPLEKYHGQGNLRFFFGTDNKKLPLQPSGMSLFVKEETIN